MITVTQPVADLLASGQAWYADLYTFRLVSGLVLRYTTADIDVSWAGNTWLSRNLDGSPLIERGDITFSLGLEVDSLELTISTDDSMTVSGLSWPHAIRVGLFDGAEVELVRAVGPLAGGVTGVIPRFTGKVGPCDPGRGKSKVTVESLLAYLRAPVPRNVYQPSCANVVYDAACGLSRAASETTVTVTSVSADGLTIGLANSLTSGRYLAGFARFVAADVGNAGQIVTVADNSANALTLLYPFPDDLLPGDLLAIAPGCAKSMSACVAFGNLQRFRGHPHVPVPETML
jgi:uncharacterized phage protein (TIGR02218 family)